MLIDLSKAASVLMVVAFAMMGTSACAGRTAAVLRSGLSGDDPALVDALSSEIKAAGYTVTEIDSATLCDAAALTSAKFDLLVLPNAGPLPAKSIPTVDAYLRGGGDLIALNAPMWQRALFEIGGKWLTREEYQRENASVSPEHVIFSFEPEAISDWRRSSNEPSQPTLIETIAEGPGPGIRALHVKIPKLTSYDTTGPETVENPFFDGASLTVFSAKGDGKTNQLAIEWNEKDGARWIAVVPLTTEWRQYVLSPQDFRFWNSNPARGFHGDRFHPENAKGMAVGLAMTHTDAVGGGAHEYWVGPIGTAKATPEFETFLSAVAPPALDTLSPGYKMYECRGVKTLVYSDHATCIPPDAPSGETKSAPPMGEPAPSDFPVPSVIRAPQPRPTASGFDKGRTWRYIPIVEAGHGGPGLPCDWSGNPVTMMVNAAGPYKGSVWASFGIGDLNWYMNPQVLKLIGKIAARMDDPVWILDAGPDRYTYFDKQDANAGLRVVNLSDETQSGITGTVEVRDVAANKVLSRNWTLTLAPGEVKSVSVAWKTRLGEPFPGSAGVDPEDPCGYTVDAELTRSGTVIDYVICEGDVLPPKKTKHFVTIKDGDFMLDGKRWRAHGVNYMPSSGIGAEDGSYFEHWIGKPSYDPEIIQRDLEHIKDMGFNSVSIFIYSGWAGCQNLVDILRRIDGLGMKANVGLRPGLPHWFVWNDIRKIIELNRLAENDAVFAYDIAWEPMWGTQAERKVWDAEWEAWIVERYGSVENAEKDWAYKTPRDESGKLTNPEPSEIDTDGPWRVMTAAYRRFLDTKLYKMYGDARRLIRGIAPNHFVSFRMAEAANPNYRWEGRIPYDFPYLAAAVDILEPEAYGRVGDWERVMPGWFQAEYGRWAAPAKPFVWAEAGVSTWDTGRMANSPARLSYAASSYENFYKLLINTAADGVYFWWYPGGFRVGENSDYGVINPDGTDREVTKVIREYGPKFVKGPDAKPVDYFITIDRDAHPDGLAGIYDRKKAEFWNQLGAGKTPGFRTEGTGTDSANCPLVAVGNTRLNGSNPPKYLDGAIDTVEVLVAGKWVPVEKGGKVKVDGGKPVVARVAVTNLGEARWLSTGTGAVALIAEGNGKLATKLTASVDHLASATLGGVRLTSGALSSTAVVTLRLGISNRTRFGEKFALTLEP